ncbi:hypothetical protein BDR07DRAFT_1609828 [Suillus spraguei]|nr:hypothetical protein BDR07DRAFT_1609828 [Suillus spraguei]
MDLEELLVREKAEQLEGGSILVCKMSQKDHNFRRVDKEDAPRVESSKSQESPSVPSKTSGLVKAPRMHDPEKLQGLCLTGTPFVLRFLEVTSERGPVAESTAFAVRDKRGYFSKVSAHAVADLLADCTRYRRKYAIIPLLVMVDTHWRGLVLDREVLLSNLQSFTRLFGHAYVSSEIRAMMDIVAGVPEAQKGLVFVYI